MENHVFFKITSNLVALGGLSWADLFQQAAKGNMAEDAQFIVCRKMGGDRNDESLVLGARFETT